MQSLWGVVPVEPPLSLLSMTWTCDPSHAPFLFLSSALSSSPHVDQGLSLLSCVFVHVLLLLLRLSGLASAAWLGAAVPGPCCLARPLLSQADGLPQPLCHQEPPLPIPQEMSLPEFQESALPNHEGPLPPNHLSRA